MDSITKSHRHKVAQFSKLLRDRKDYSGAPILLRLLWRMGFKIPPPYFLSFPVAWILSCLSNGLSVGFALALAGVFFGSFPLDMITLVACFSGLVNGSIRAILWRKTAKKMYLPKWKDFSLDELDVNYLDK
jgi:Family of unknown function (DUF6404)